MQFFTRIKAEVRKLFFFKHTDLKKNVFGVLPKNQFEKQKFF